MAGSPLLLERARGLALAVPQHVAQAGRGRAGSRRWPAATRPGSGTRNARRGCPACACSNTGISRRHGGHQLAHRFTTAGLPRKAAGRRGRRLQVAQDQFGERGMRLRRRRRDQRVRPARPGWPRPAPPAWEGAGARRRKIVARQASPGPPARSGRSSRRRAGPAWTAVPADRRRGTARDSPAVRRRGPRAAHSTRHCGRWGVGGGYSRSGRRRRASSAQASRLSAADSSSTPSSRKDQGAETDRGRGGVRRGRREPGRQA